MPATERAPRGSRHVASEAHGASLELREQAERCRRLARDSIDPAVRDGLLRLAVEYAARAASMEGPARKTPGPDSDDQEAT
jgi:hypothetical protein